MSATSSKELFVLGRLSLRATYGHEIMRTLASSRADLWVELSEKHVYYILRKLERDGFVSVSNAPPGSRPGRHVYSVTSAGHAEFRRLIRSERLVESLPYSDFDVVFGMLTYADQLSPSEKSAVLEARVQHLESVAARAEEANALAAEAGGARLSSRVFDKVSAVARAELEWLNQVIADVDRDGWPPANPNIHQNFDSSRSDS